MSPACPMCNERHSYLGDPYKELDLEYGLFRWYQDKTCTCGEVLPRIEITFIAQSYAWKTGVQGLDEKARTVYALADQGLDKRAIAEQSGLTVERVEKYLHTREMLKAQS